MNFSGSSTWNGHFSLSSSCPSAGGEERSCPGWGKPRAHIHPQETIPEGFYPLKSSIPLALSIGISELPLAQTQFQYQETNAAVQVSSGAFIFLQPNSADLHPEGICLSRIRITIHPPRRAQICSSISPPFGPPCQAGIPQPFPGVRNGIWMLHPGSVRGQAGWGPQ